MESGTLDPGTFLRMLINFVSLTGSLGLTMFEDDNGRAMVEVIVGHFMSDDPVDWMVT